MIPRKSRRCGCVGSLVAVLGLIIAVTASTRAGAVDARAIEHGLTLAIDGTEKQVDLDEALRLLNVPSVSIAVVDQGGVAFARAYGKDANPATLYQAASLSKFVTAVGAMRLVEQGKIGLDRNVNDLLRSWKVPATPLTESHPVTMRGLLSMTAGIGVPGFTGYAAGKPLPTLDQVLNGAPPANSSPVTVIAVPGSAYHYSGGGTEIAEAVMQDVTGEQFPDLMQQLVLRPGGMSDSSFIQPSPDDLAGRAASGHLADGSELPGHWHNFPEHAAAGLWSTPIDLARLLVTLTEAWHEDSPAILKPETMREMLKPQNGGPYGLGAAVAGSGQALVLMKRGQNVGYQSYLILYPETGQGMVVMTNSDNGSKLADALIKRAALAYGWPPLPPLAD